MIYFFNLNRNGNRHQKETVQSPGFTMVASSATEQESCRSTDKELAFKTSKVKFSFIFP